VQAVDSFMRSLNIGKLRRRVANRSLGRGFIVFVLLLGLVLPAIVSNTGVATPVHAQGPDEVVVTNTPTTTPEETPVLTDTPTATPEVTPVPTDTPTTTPEVTPVPSEPPTPEPTLTPTPEPTPTPTPTPTPILPEIMAVSPKSGSTGVSIDTEISVTFSEAMDKTSVEGAFSITPEAKGTFRWEDNSLVLTPEKKLKYDTTYTVIISTEANDVQGHALDKPYTFTVTTRSAPSKVALITGLIVVIAVIAVYLTVRRKKRSKVKV